ncbi:EAL domain-containing protein [Devosia sp.]|uniref:EAL domain-containing protein n=1 Tax=Devosia sp. TaxID=1871048 RepID=UPI003A9334B5
MTARATCDACRSGEAFPVAFTMAFQPIIDAVAGSVWGYEALVRGTDGAGAAAVLGAVTEANRYHFDQDCRVKAIELAGAGLIGNDTARLSINFKPNAVYEPRACIRASLAAAERVGFAPTRLMFEFTEDERIDDVAHVQNIVESYKRMGFTTALDDFGAGHAGLSLLAAFQPDVIKLDMNLLRGVDAAPARQVVIRGILGIAAELGVTVLAEGIETEAEFRYLRSLGIRLFQGYYLARPEIETFRPASAIPLLQAVAA